jgi:hypothetical protein
MDNKKRELLEEEIKTQIENLKYLSGEEYTAMVQNIEKMYKLNIEDVNTEAQRELEKVKAKDQKLDKNIDRGINLGMFGAQMGIFWYWLNKGFKFEETGMFASPSFKNLYNNIFKFKFKK